MAKKPSREYHLYGGKIFGLIADVLSILSWIGIPLSVFLSILQQSWAWIIPSLLLVIILVLLALCRKYSRSIVHWVLGLFALNLPYRFLSRTSEYEYISSDRMQFRTTYEVKALQTGVDYIRARFNWSGETDINAVQPKPVLEEENKIYTARLEPDGREYGYSYYKVFSPSRHNKGDAPFHLGTCSDLKVGDRPVSHHLLTSISATTDVLHMRVILPEHLSPHNIEFFEYLHATDEHHWHRYEGEAKRHGKKWVITWDIEQPIYGGKYLITWTFAQGVT